MSGKKLFQVQDRGTITGPGLLYYTKSILSTGFSNVCISIGLVNEAWYQAISIIPDENGIFNFWKVHDLANSYSNLLSNRYKYYVV